MKSIYERFRGVSYGLKMSKIVHYLRFNIDWVKAFGRQSDHRSASRSRGLYIFRYFDVFGLVSVFDISFFHAPWGLLTMRWKIAHYRFPTQTSVLRLRQRRLRFLHPFTT